MLNVNQITSTLAKLPDAALQKYAAMHKNDPYVMALAVAESNRRKEMRASAQQPAQQPKVVDQEVQSMAAPMPEDQGIAQLPAGNMEFADGGIVAFAGGGAPSGAIVRNPNPTKEELEKARRQTQMYIEGAQAAAAGRPTTVDRAEAPVAKASWEQDLEDLQAQNVDMGDNWLTYSSDKAAMQDRQNAAQAAAKGQDVGSVFTPDPNSGLRQLAQAAGDKGNEQADMTADAGAGGGGRGTGIGGQDIMSMYNASLDEVRKGRTDGKADVESIGAAREALAAEQLAGLKGINEKFADIYKGRKERLDTRESELGARKDQYMGLALLQAGAAMMSTPGGLGTAIGKGVDVGSKQYGEGLQRLNDAKEKLFDARDKLDELNANRQEMSAREILKAEGGVKEAAIASKENMLKYIMDTEKVDRETATKLLDAKIRLGVANIQASAAGKSGESMSVMREYDRIKATKGEAAAEAYLQRFERIKGFGKADPGLKDPAYKAAVEEANRMQRMADATTDPAKKQQYQTIADNKRKEAEGYLRGGNRGDTGVNSPGASTQKVVNWSDIQ